VLRQNENAIDKSDSGRGVREVRSENKWVQLSPVHRLLVLDGLLMNRGEAVLDARRYPS